MAFTYITSQEIPPISWVTPTLSTGWTSFDTGTIPTSTTQQWRFPRYTKDAAGVVHITGLAKNNSGASNTGTTNSNVFTLPAGFRPGHTQRMTTSANGSGDGWLEFDIEPTGAVNILGTVGVSNQNWVSLNNIHFLAEQ